MLYVNAIETATDHVTVVCPWCKKEIVLPLNNSDPGSSFVVLDAGRVWPDVVCPHTVQVPGGRWRKCLFSDSLSIRYWEKLK